MNRYGGEVERRRRPGGRDLIARPGAPRRRHSPSGTGQRARHSQPTRSRRNLSQKLAPRQAAIAQPALRVQDLQLRRTARRPKPIPRHTDFGSLTNHVPAQPNPPSTAQLQPQRRDLSESARQGGGHARWLQNEHLDAGSTGQGSQSTETLRKIRRRNPSPQRPGRQVQQQQVHRSILEKHGRHRQRLLERVRRQDDQPLELNASSHGLHRIQASGQIQIRRDPAGGLGLGHGPQRECRLTAGPIAVEGSRRGARQPAQPEDRVQGSKAG